MAEKQPLKKPVHWIGSSRDDLRGFPSEARVIFGFAILQAELGGKHIDAKPLKGFGGAGVLEVVADHDRNTYRSVYTVKLQPALYVLHAFQKKSKKGIQTPQKELEKVTARLKLAIQHHEENYEQKNGPKATPRKT